MMRAQQHTKERHCEVSLPPAQTWNLVSRVSASVAGCVVMWWPAGMPCPRFILHLLSFIFPLSIFLLFFLWFCGAPFKSRFDDPPPHYLTRSDRSQMWPAETRAYQPAAVAEEEEADWEHRLYYTPCYALQWLLVPESPFSCSSSVI